MRCALLSVLIPAMFTAATAAQTAFTYQGRIKNGTQPANGLHDLRFSLFDSASGGAQLGTTQCMDNVNVTEGLFTTTVDFGQQYITPNTRFLEIEARADTGLGCSDAGGFVVLGPRQPMTVTPQAAHARSAFSLAAPDGSPAAALFVDNIGRIGIGTTTPSQPVQVANDLPVLILQDSGSTSTQSGYLGFWNSSGAETGWIGFGSATNSDFGITNTRSGGAFRFFTAGGERLSLLTSGNVGIGTGTPQAKLDVRGPVKLGSSGELFAPGGVENLRIIRGTVSANGNRITGTGFTSSHPGTGDYTITFDTPFPVNTRPSVTATCEFVSGQTGRTAHTDVVGNGALNIVILGSGVLADTEFSFIAVGPQ